MVNILVNGYKGKLGRAICEIAAEQYSSAARICAGIDVAAVPGDDNAVFPVYKDLNDCDVVSNVIIDCSVARAVPGVIDYAIKNNTPLLVCTTGLSDDTIEKISAASEKIAVFRSANMSLGVNLLISLVEKATALLADAGFDIEIVERHHNQKMDAPSGTALMLAKAANNAVGGKYELVFGRKPEDYKKRGKNELGIHSVRGGTITGDHTVIFAGNDEVIELSHSAFSKNVFAHGAIKAARFLAEKGAGLYTMGDLMKE